MGGEQPLIQGSRLRKTYHVGDQVVHALDGLDLDIGTNEYVALMGPSGSGKSTLMNMLGCGQPDLWNVLPQWTRRQSSRGRRLGGHSEPGDWVCVSNVQLVAAVHRP